jgi:hypothetical protein
MKTKKYTESQFKDAVASSISIRQVLDKLGLKKAGGNYASCRKRINELQLDTSHFRGQGWAKGKTFTPKRELSEYLSNSQSIQSYKLKNRLIKDKILPYICDCCKLEIWLEKPIPLELDHINGNPEDNSLCNLRLLCPNCHALTPNYRGKNKKSF